MNRWDQIRAMRNASSEQLSETEKQRALTDALYHRVFTTPDGRQLLEHFFAQTVDRATGEAVSDGALRALEAQRNFVRGISSRVARHAERVSKTEKRNAKKNG